MQTLTIGDRVKHAIEEINRGHYLIALEHASIAIDMTAKKLYKSKLSGRKIYTDLLEKYYWILELMSFQGINLPDSKFGNIPFEWREDQIIEEPNYKDILYHIVRCGLIHGEPPGSVDLVFDPHDIIFIKDKLLHIPSRVIWGLLGIVVFCSANTSGNTAQNCFFTIDESKNHHKFIIDDVWGREDLLLPIYENYLKNNPRVALNIPYTHFNSSLKNPSD